MKCPNCAKKITLKVRNTAMRRETSYKNVIGVFQCQHCQAVLGECYKGDSYSIVKPWFVKVDPPIESTRYYDLDVLGSNGVERRHGWFEVSTGLIVQVG